MSCCRPPEKFIPAIQGEISQQKGHYGVVAKGLLTVLGSLHKEVAKTTAGTLVYRFERQTEKYCVLNLECRMLSQEPSDNFILYFNVIFHVK